MDIEISIHCMIWYCSSWCRRPGGQRPTDATRPRHLCCFWRDCSLQLDLRLCPGKQGTQDRGPGISPGPFTMIVEIIKGFVAPTGSPTARTKDAVSVVTRARPLLQRNVSFQHAAQLSTRGRTGLKKAG